MFSLIKKAKYHFFWAIDRAVWTILFKTQRKKRSNRSVTNNYFSIGITTFMNRYDSCFKPLLQRICYLFPETEIIVSANGHYKSAEQLEYLERIEKYCSKYRNVRLVKYERPQGLSKLWNQLIILARNEKIVLLNDDLVISRFFHLDMQKANIYKAEVCTINRSWSNFLISKAIIGTVGWFDERMYEFGGEDDDYQVRLIMNNIELDNSFLTSIKAANTLKQEYNSYGKKTSDQVMGYSNVNTDFLLNKKWIASNDFFEGAIFVRDRGIKYWKLREGMETPNFYEDIQY